MFSPATLLPALCGYAVLFNRPTNRRDHGRRLQFAPGAFDGFLSRSRCDVYAAVNHEGESVAFASTPRGSLLLDSDSHGVFIIALARNDPNGRITCCLVRGGHASKMSAEVHYDGADVQRAGDVDIVTRARISEVSGVARPAIPGTLLCIADTDAVPRTIDALRAEGARLRRANLHYECRGKLREWKEQKAVERAALLRTVTNQPILATA